MKPVTAELPSPALRGERPPARELELSIVMPCLNEAETLEPCIRKALGYIEEAGIEGEVIIADNGSTDGSQELSRRLGARVVDIPHRGYGAALQGGIAAAHGRFVIMGDSDDSYDFSRLTAFVEKLREGYDVVLGNRFLGGIEPDAMPPLHRYFGNPLITFIGRLFFGGPSHDFYCGLRGFRRDAAMRMNLQSTGMEFALEMVVKSTMIGMKTIEVPTTLSPDGRSRAPHLRSWVDGWRSLRFFLLASPRWLFFYPGILLAVSGFAMALFWRPPEAGAGLSSVDLVNWMAAAALIGVGYQATIFSFFAKILAMTTGILPRVPEAERRFKRRRILERGLLIGGSMLLIGLAGIGYSLLGESPQTPEALKSILPKMRFIGLSSLLIMIGLQTMFSSFFLKLLQLHLRGTTSGDERLMAERPIRARGASSSMDTPIPPSSLWQTRGESNKI